MIQHLLARNKTWQLHGQHDGYDIGRKRARSQDSPARDLDLDEIEHQRIVSAKIEAGFPGRRDHMSGG